MQQVYGPGLRKSLCPIFVSFFIVLMCVVANGQTGGRVTGIVTDEAGAAVAGATVIVTSTERDQQVAKIETTNDGTYSIASLIPGTYSISVEKTGFAKTVISSMKIDVAQITRLDISLKVS